jgi:hypothetical protein
MRVESSNNQAGAVVDATQTPWQSGTRERNTEGAIPSMSEFNAAAEHATTTLSEGDRERLAFHLSRASEKAFPHDERIGKTPQQDFYFRELLDVLIENALRYGTPAAGGAYVEIWQFTRDRVGKWRANPNWQRGRSGYGRESVKTLVHEWVTAFERRRRVVPLGTGIIEFFLDRPGRYGDDLVLRAEVVNFDLLSGTKLNWMKRELSDDVRFRAVRIARDEFEEKQRLLREARKFVRRVEAEYLTKLANAPFAFVEEEVKELQRARRNHRRLAAAILALVSSAMVAYKILYLRNVRPLVELTPGKMGRIANVIADTAGRVALATPSGQRTSDWADRIVGDNGVSVTHEPNGDLIQTTPTDDADFVLTVPDEWHQRPEVVLPAQASCTNSSKNARGIVCMVLLDLRRWDPSATIDSVALGANFGDEQTVTHVPAMPIEGKTRIAVQAAHVYAKYGVYPVKLVWSTDPRFRQLKRGETIHMIAREIVSLGRFEVLPGRPLRQLFP